jgi:hypothetical protein
MSTELEMFQGVGMIEMFAMFSSWLQDCHTLPPCDHSLLENWDVHWSNQAVRTLL